MVNFDVNKDKARVEKLLYGINKICVLIDAEDVSPEWVTADKLGTKVTKSMYLCPCGVLTTIEEKQEILKKDIISVLSEKCGIK